MCTICVGMCSSSRIAGSIHENVQRAEHHLGLTTMTGELVFLSACDLARKLQTGEVAAREVLEAHLEQIARVNPQVNAIVTLTAERAVEEAAAADDAFAATGPIGPLHGI